MDEFVALLAAIRAQPQEDTPRLVAADWLDENGEPDFAEFIRVQVELAGMIEPDVPRTDEYDEHFTYLIERERHLLAGPMRLLFGQLLRGANGSDEEPDLSEVMRGFLDDLDCLPRWWVSQGDTLLTWLPLSAVGLWSAPALNEDEEGIAIVGDAFGTHFLRRVVLAEQQPGERIELAICRLRWPGVRFEILSIDATPAQPPPLPPFVQPHTDDANMVAIQEAHRRRQHVAGFVSNPPAPLT